MSLALHLTGDAFRPWMKIPIISVPLHLLLKPSVIDPKKVTFTEKWKERQVLHRILPVLHLMFEEWGLAFDDFARFCESYHHPSNLITFSSVDEPLMHFSGDKLIVYINPPSPLPTASSPPSITPHCHLNVQFVGHAAHQLAEFLRRSVPTWFSQVLHIFACSIYIFACSIPLRPSTHSLDDRAFMSPEAVSFSPVVTPETFLPSPSAFMESPPSLPVHGPPSPSAIRRTTGHLLRSFGATAVRVGTRAAHVVPSG
jgi:hypothetical protein